MKINITILLLAAVILGIISLMFGFLYYNIYLIFCGALLLGGWIAAKLIINVLK